MTQIEIAELVKDTSVCEIATKTVKKLNMTDNEKVVAEQLDEWARKIGETGHDPDHEIAAFITLTINDEFYDAPNELLDSMFERGSIGEFDDYEAVIQPVKNTLIAHEAARGGNVEKSYLDFSILKPTYRNRQVETQISYVDLRRSGWKSVALLTDYVQLVYACKRTFELFRRFCRFDKATCNILVLLCHCVAVIEFR